MSVHEKKAEEIVAQKINLNTPSIMAFEAACLLLAIEGGTHHLAIESSPIFQKINQYARKNGPHGKWCSARGFLEEFVKRHTPGFDRQEDARQGEIEDGIRKQEDEQFAQEHAEDARWKMSWAMKYYTPPAPDAVLLCNLAWDYRRSATKRRRFIRRTWPTLRGLKLATAIPERTLKKIIKSLRPKNGEIIKEPVRHKFSTRGAVPLRYGPRLVIGRTERVRESAARFCGRRRRTKTAAKNRIARKAGFCRPTGAFASKHLAPFKELIRSAGF